MLLTVRLVSSDPQPKALEQIANSGVIAMRGLASRSATTLYTIYYTVLPASLVFLCARRRVFS